MSTLTQHLARLGRLVAFGVWFLREMVRANWQVARDLLTPGSNLTPGVVALPVRSHTRNELTILADLITLTPGTLTVEVDRHAHVLYVLGLYAPADPEAFRAELMDLEDRMLHAVRLPSRTHGRASGRPSTLEGGR